MMAQLLGWIFVLVFAAALIRALVKGVIEFDPGGRGYMSADRAKKPGSFWGMFSIGLLTLAFFVWLLIT